MGRQSCTGRLQRSVALLSTQIFSMAQVPCQVEAAVHRAENTLVLIQNGSTRLHKVEKIKWHSNLGHNKYTGGPLSVIQEHPSDNHRCFTQWWLKLGQ